MREILTQEEVDALLEAYDSGEISEQAPSEGGFFTPFDFSSRKLIGGAQQNTLERIQDALAKGCTTAMTQTLGRDATVTVSSTYTEPNAGFLAHFKHACCLGILTVGSVRGSGFLALSPYLAYAFIDLMLGGEGKVVIPEGKEFTVLETRIVKRVVEALAIESTRAWSTVLPDARFSVVKIETIPKNLPGTDIQDPLYIVNLHVETDSGLSRDFSLAVPFSLLDPLKETAPAPEVDPKAKEMSSELTDRLGSIPVGITVRMGEAYLPVQEILSLKVGDVITTGTGTTDPIVLLVEGKPKLLARAGNSRGKRAVKIVGTASVPAS